MTGDIAQKLQALAAIIEDLDVVSRIHMVAQNHELQFSDIWHLLLASVVTVHIWCTYLQACKTHVHIKKLVHFISNWLIFLLNTMQQK